MMLENTHCLVVEDNEQAQRLLRMLLRDIGVTQVYTAGDGREAQAYLDNEIDHLDLIIADWAMPRMTGLDLLRQVRMTHADLPFLMVTARCDREAVMAAKRFGVTDYVVKPYAVDTLERKVRDLLPAA